MKNKPIAAGKSSFSLVDSNKVFSEIGLTKNITMLDVACGIGAYALAASPHVGPSGKIFAVDLWQDGIDTLKAEIEEPRSKLRGMFCPAAVLRIDRKEFCPI